jgi:hypothetical protein
MRAVYSSETLALTTELYVMTTQKVIVVEISSVVCENKRCGRNIVSLSGRLLTGAK